MAVNTGPVRRRRGLRPALLVAVGLALVGGSAAPAVAERATPSPRSARAASVPSAPTGLVFNVGDKRVSLAWYRGNDGGSPITDSLVTPYINGVAQPVRSANLANGLIMTDLHNGTTYTFRVAHKNAVGVGAKSAPSDPATPNRPVTPHTPFASYNELVRQQYTDLTTVKPTSANESAWVSDIAQGRKTKGDLVAALRKGADNTGNVDPTVRIYRAFLGRAPDADGLRFWIKRKRTKAPARTWSVTQIATEFTKGSEFIRKYGAKTNREFVTLIYTDVLGRPADASGVDYWTGKLDNGSRTRATVMVGFSESSEYKTKQAQNTDVTVAYVYLMGRAPSASEINDWVTRQKAGTTVAALSIELLNSDEYRDRFGWYD